MGGDVAAPMRGRIHAAEGIAQRICARLRLASRATTRPQVQFSNLRVGTDMFKRRPDHSADADALTTCPFYTGRHIAPNSPEFEDQAEWWPTPASGFHAGLAKRNDLAVET